MVVDWAARRVDAARARLRRPSPIEDRLRAAGLPPLGRLAWAEIDTDALAGNLQVARALAPAGTRVAAVVKADAYGHGLEVAARTFAAAGADLLCVATLDEGLLVRGLGLAIPTLVIFEVPPSGVGEAAAAGLELTASDPAGLGELLTAASRTTAGRVVATRRLRLHLEVESGFVRGGFPPEATGAAARRIHDAPGVELVGLWTHLASPYDAAVTTAQRARFEAATRSVAAAGVPIPARHWASSGGLLAGVAAASALVRIGLLVYGAVPDGVPVPAAVRPLVERLRPAMALKARPVRVAEVAAGEAVGYGGTWVAPRPSVVATLPVGYGDGWSRAYGGRTAALVRGRHVPLVGTVAMDAVLADVTDVARAPGALGRPVTTADEFVLLGAQGDARITVADLAHVRTTISWEVLAGVSARVARVYHAATGLTGLRTLAGEHRRAGEQGGGDPVVER